MFVFTYVSQHSNTIAQETVVYTDTIVSQTHFQTPWILLTTIEQVTSPEWEKPSAPVEILYVLFFCMMPVLYQCICTAFLYQFQLHLYKLIFFYFFFNQFKRKLTVLNGIGIMILSCRINILPGGNRTFFALKTSLRTSISLCFYHTTTHTKVPWSGCQKISNVYIALRFDTKLLSV